MVAVSLCGLLKQRGHRFFVHNPDGVFEIQLPPTANVAALDGIPIDRSIHIGGVMHTSKRRNYISPVSLQPLNVPAFADYSDHLTAVLTVSLGAKA